MSPRAFVTGITGQDGSYLAELLLSKGYEVHGLIRRASTFNTARIDHIYQDPHDPHRRLFLHYGDLTDGSMLTRLLAEVQPDELYNLAAQSHVGVSFEMPEYTTDTVGLGTLRLLESLRAARLRPRVYQASSSEMYGNVSGPKDERTPLDPSSPYAAAKVLAHHVAGLYRKAYGMFVARGILFNHESPRRGPTFVTRKVTMGVASICAGKQEKLYLGNLGASRDWGYAPEYVEGMWLMLQVDEPGDFVLATGQAFTVRELCETAFSLVGLDWQEYVETDPRYERPVELHDLVGDASRAHRLLGWTAETDFHTLVRTMLQADLALLDVNPVDHMSQPSNVTRPEWARVA